MPPLDIAEAKARGVDLAQLLLDRLQLVEPEEADGAEGAVPPGLDTPHGDEPATDVAG